MAHHSRLYKVIVDVPDDDHDRELAFWRGALGQELQQSKRYAEYHGDELPWAEFGLLVQRLGDGPARVHLDIHTDDIDAEVERLERLGATRVQKVNRWWVMTDPAGLPFCVIPDEPGTLTGDNARRWD